VDGGQDLLNYFAQHKKKVMQKKKDQPKELILATKEDELL